MESELLQLILIFVAGLLSGALIMLLWNKLSSGSASPSGVKQEYQDYQDKVEAHFEETSKKFKDMTEQYQDLYKHLSVGATSLCRPDSVAAVLADKSEDTLKIESKELTDAEKEAQLKEQQARAAKEKVDRAIAEESKNKKNVADTPKQSTADEKPAVDSKPVADKAAESAKDLSESAKGLSESAKGLKEDVKKAT